jgi:DNA-binding winged helix-turn-helix (wHTH) protein
MMRFLVCLAEHAGGVVSVEQLLDQVWKDVIVTPNSVYHAVATLRRILGDDAKNPTYIANTLRRGYRLVTPVVPWVDAQSVQSADSSGAEAEASTSPNTNSMTTPMTDRSIAVLPFVDMSEKQDQGYFADGMAHAQLAFLYAIYDWDWAAVVGKVQRALALDPRDPGILVTAGIIHLARIAAVMRASPSYTTR